MPVSRERPNISLNDESLGALHCPVAIYQPGNAGEVATNAGKTWTSMLFQRRDLSLKTRPETQSRV